MSLYLRVRGQLLADGATAALVGTRVYPTYLPQAPTYPAITYQRVSNTGQSGSTSLRQTRWQINCWAATYVSVQSLATAVKSAMEEWTNGSQMPLVKMARVVNELDDYEPEIDVHRVIIDVLIDTIGD